MINRINLPEEMLQKYPLLNPESPRRILLSKSNGPVSVPAYEAEGLWRIPVPVFRWKRGQCIDQTLLDLQMHLCDRMLKEAPASLHTLIVSESRYIRVAHPLPAIPDADIVCFGLWVDALQASKHDVFCMERNAPGRLAMLLQNPTVEQLAELTLSHLTLMDSGLWLLSDKALEILEDHNLSEVLSELNVAVVPLSDAECYTFTTTHDMLASTMALQNAVQDQRLILQRNTPKIPSLFTQNARVEVALSSKNFNIWIENSHVPASWEVTCNNVITGVPENNWTIRLAEGVCVRVFPVGDAAFEAAVYDIDGKFAKTAFCEDQNALGEFLSVALAPDASALSFEKDAEQTSTVVNIQRLNEQRRTFLKDNLTTIARNHRKSVFYQVNLKDMAQKFADFNLPEPAPLDESVAQLLQIRDAMFRSQLHTLRGQDGTAEEARAFSLLRDGLTEPAYVNRQLPQLDVYPDQIVWGRSAVRIDVAGGWTDTPPYCLNAGGNVVNLAIELNDQQPLQVYVKPCKEYKIICRSIDLGATEYIETFDELSHFHKLGSPFSIPKAALALCGFLPQFCKEPQASLHEQLEAFGSGIEITLLSAIPAGSGLGTSSILAATVLGALSDFCGLGWDHSSICNRTLILEQLLTAGGGWQDQYGGVLHGVKLLQTGAGFDQTPVARWLPDQLWNEPEMRQCHLLYYTGITRTAKHILAEIVRGMFLNSSDHLTLLGEMKQQALDMFDVIQRGDIQEYGRLVRKTWNQNKSLDSGTEPPLVAQLCSKIDDLCSGYKLPGAGGGGYLYMVAKDPDAAARIKRILSQDPITKSARFVDMKLSKKGLQVSRS